MPPKLRLERIAERVYEDISELLIYEIQDPRLGGVSVTDVNIDRELAFADIYVSCLAGSEAKDEVLAGLQSAAGFIRGRLAKSIQLRTFPVLRFHWDPTPERADRIERLLYQLHENDSATQNLAAQNLAAQESAGEDVDLVDDAEEDGEDEE